MYKTETASASNGSQRKLKQKQLKFKNLLLELRLNLPQTFLDNKQLLNPQNIRKLLTLVQHVSETCGRFYEDLGVHQGCASSPLLFALESCPAPSRGEVRKASFFLKILKAKRNSNKGLGDS